MKQIFISLAIFLVFQLDNGYAQGGISWRRPLLPGGSLLDYGDSIYAPTVCELTVALAYSLMNTSNVIEKCCYMVESFQSEFPLNKSELEAISSLIASRLLISVTMAAKQKKKYPNNNYLSISEKDAWDLLFKLNDINFISIAKWIEPRINNF